MSKSTYSELHPAPIDATISSLASRIAERFPESGLSRLAAELVRLARENQRVIEQLRRPLWWLRVLIALAITAVLGIALWLRYSCFVWVLGGLVPCQISCRVWMPPLTS